MSGLLSRTARIAMLSLFGLTLATTLQSAVAQTVVGSYTVEFATGSARLSAQALNVVQQAAGRFQEGEAASINIVGHTDTVGSAELNQALSERRAAAVRSALVDQGVPSRAISVDAVGQTRLIVETPDGVAEQANRVAVINLLRPFEPEPAPAPVVAEPPAPTFFGLDLNVGPYYGFDVHNDQNLVGGNITADYYVTDNISIGVEQAGFYVFGNRGRDSGAGGRSVASLDYHFRSLGPLTGINGYVGANVGGIYGRNTENDVIYGPEIGTSFGPFTAKVAYDIRSEGFDSGVVSATLGYRLRF